MNFPKIGVIYFKQLLDWSFQRFLRENNGSFSRMTSGYRTIYVYSGTKSRTSLKKTFLSFVLDELFDIFSPFDIENPSYGFVIGSCLPRNNILLKCVGDKNPLPKSLSKLIFSGHDLRYYCPEKDVKVDLDLFNSVFEDVFLELFDRKKARKLMGDRFRNVFFLRHVSLDCYMTFKLLRMEYGRNTVENMVEKLSASIDVGLKSINERIDERVSGKISFLKSEILRPVREEVLGFVRGCLFGNALK